MSKVLDTLEVNGGNVEITERHAKIFAKRFGVEYVESNVPGIVGSLAGWVNSPEAKDADAYLLESPETRDEFAAIRDAFNVKISGAVKPVEQFSNVSIVEVIPDWATFVEELNAAPAEEAKPEGEAGAEGAQA